MQIASYSLHKAADRLARAKRKRVSPDEDEMAELREQEELVKRVRRAPDTPHVQALSMTQAPPRCYPEH